MYNMLFGVNEFADALLASLGTNRGAVPRFRDCYLDGERIAIHTRTGGGNRDFYESEQSCRDHFPEYFTGSDDPAGPWNSDLRKLPGFLYDEDDDFDATYATFYYAIPDELRGALDKVQSSDGEVLTPSEKWQRLFAALQESNNDA